MIFLMPFHAGDKPCAEQTLAWVKELGGCAGHSIILMPAKAVLEFDRIRKLAIESFDKVDVLPDAEGIEGHPQGPNCMMRQAIWHMQTAGLGPWMFWEPDCIPMCAGFADSWDREYRAFGKPFMGEFRAANGSAPDYLTGNMVLPKDALLLAPMLARRGLSRDGVELAFDIVAAAQTLPQAHLTKQLQQVPKESDGGGYHFPDQASLSIIRPEAVLFHPCKDGSLIERLREKSAACVGADRGLTSSALPPGGSNPSAADFENLKRENEILRAELLKLKNSTPTSHVAPGEPANGRSPHETAVGAEPRTHRKAKRRHKAKRSPEQQAAIDARMAKARAARKVRAAA